MLAAGGAVGRTVGEALAAHRADPANSPPPCHGFTPNTSGGAVPGVCTFEMPVPPSTNHLFVTGGVRRFKSQEYRLWLSRTVAKLQVSRAMAGWNPPAGPVRAVVEVGHLESRSRDLDNFLKPVLDAAVKAGILATDNLTRLVELSARYCPDRPAGVLLTLEAIA
jgi:Holliday junction resolvase RusA-like endonuclease